MNDKQYARTCFGNPGLFDFIVHPIVSALTGQAQSTIAQISRTVEPYAPKGFLSGLAEPLIRTGAQFVPALQQVVDIGDEYTSRVSDMFNADEDDDPGSTDQEEFD